MVFDQAMDMYPAVPSRHCLWVLIYWCFQHYGNYLCRHVPPALTADFAASFDSLLYSLVGTVTGLDINSLPEPAAVRLRLPVHFKGCGIRSLSDRRHAEFIGAMMQGFQMLVNHWDKKDRLQHGLLHTHPLLDLVGEGSFDYSSTTPWLTLLSEFPTSHLACGIQDAFKGQLDLCAAVGMDTECSDWFGGEAASAGTAGDGLDPSLSITHEWTASLEKAQFDWLNKGMRSGQLAHAKSILQLAFINVDRYSSQFLTSQPDSIGFLDDRKFMVAFANYLGVHCPIFKSFAGSYIAHKSLSTQVDPYGHRVAAFPALPGGHHRILHHEVRNCLARIMSGAGLVPKKEANNMFAGLVPHDLYDQYLGLDFGPNGDGMIPDIMVQDFPEKGSDKKEDTEIDLGMASDSKAAIFEVKGVRVGVNRYGRRPRALLKVLGPFDSARETDLRAREIKSEYLKKARKLDVKLAPSVTAEADEQAREQRLIGPFESAYHMFARKGVIPCVVGAFSETNHQFDGLLKTLAKLAADNDSCLVPPGVSDLQRKAFFITEFRRAMGVAICRANCALKIQRIPFLGPTVAAAKLRAQQEVDKRSTSYLVDCPSWYNRNIQDEQSFQAWATFRGRRHVLPQL